MSEPVVVVQTERHSRRRVPKKEVFGGIILIGLGILFYVAQTMPEFGRQIGDYIVLVVGVALLLLFLLTRAYGALVPGGIVTGVGLGIVLQQAAERGEIGIDGASVFLISLGAGFILIWVIGLLFRVPENHWWPFIPGLILIAIGLLQAAGPQADSFRDLLQYGWPVVLIVLGAIVLLRATFRRRSET